MKQSSLKTKIEIFTVAVVLITVAILAAVFTFNGMQAQTQLKTSIAGKQDVIEKMIVNQVVGEMEKSVFAFTREAKLLKGADSDNKCNLGKRSQLS